MKLSTSEKRLEKILESMHDVIRLKEKPVRIFHEKYIDPIKARGDMKALNCTFRLN